MRLRAIQEKAPKMQETVFVLTCMWLTPDGLSQRDRTWGWFQTLEQAEESIFSNDADIYENGSYNAVVVEEMPCGTMSLANAEHWYSVKPKTRNDTGCIESYKVEKIDKPEGQRQVCNFGMG